MTSQGLPDDGAPSRADEAVFRPVREGNAFEETVERLLQAIKLGVVAPGERLPSERDLAARFKVARETLREAIRALAEAGYVESRRGRYGGTFVRAEQPSGRSRGAARRTAEQMGPELDDALLLRDVLEVGAAGAAASAPLSQTERLHLRGRLEECAGSSVDDYRRMDSRLHLAIAEVTGSASLTAAVADVRMRLNEMLDAIPLLERNMRHSNAQHTRIVDAVLDGDADAARRAMAEHLDGTTALLRGFLS
ncbi:FadR/GntR family transcriptional regulator [Nocardioides sp.]|uniref:FadR/GntR family transcriptional regulator n=1 Tax=Nocardioides sp. TaxID=35761 RepID=UPI002D7FF97F|nr:GntR family transcriptional regulator [Nocardioides sp.]HET8961913.1 GntR family transcriptional regulator [Nocardioides sp.]